MTINAVHIGNLSLTDRAVLAPMAGAADSAFRLTARTFGASLVFTELISADGLVRNSPKTFKLMEFLPEERPVGIQLFGCDPVTAALAAKRAEQLKPDLIDLNFGCPSRKIVKRGMGAAMMKNLENLEAMVRSVVLAVETPVSVKLRSGWNSESVTAVEAAQAAQQAGARLITIHPRTQTQGFTGTADWDLIRLVKRSVTIPVVGNGDVETPLDAKRLVDETGCDFVMIGRGALGRPWIFRQINRYLSTGQLEDDPLPRERIAICLAHFQKAVECLGEKRAVFEMRKHIGWYVKGLMGSTSFRRRVFQMTDVRAVADALRCFAEESGSDAFPIPVNPHEYA